MEEVAETVAETVEEAVETVEEAVEEVAAEGDDHEEDVSGLFGAWGIPGSSNSFVLKEDMTYLLYFDGHLTTGTWKVDDAFVVLTPNAAEGEEPVEIRLPIDFDEAGNATLTLTEGEQDYIFYCTTAAKAA